MTSNSLIAVYLLAAGLVMFRPALGAVYIDLEPITQAAEAPVLVPAEAGDVSASVNEVGVNEVVIHYREHGKLFALVPVMLPVTVRASADGEVDVNYPWYSALTVDLENELETELKIAADKTIRRSKLGWVKAEGESSGQIFSPSEARDLESALRQVLKARLGN